MYTPIAKSSKSWTQVSGAVFPGADAGSYDPSSSSTTPSVNFYAVRFLNGDHGFAGGAVCADLKAPLDSCTRVPALYEYAQVPGQPGAWSDARLPVTDDAAGRPQPGFVAAIAFIGEHEALAVGGDGAYPYYEQPAGGTDPAGHARAWLYRDGVWRELHDLPSGMTGLTALDCAPRDRQPGRCIAGGYQQLWRWQNDHFDHGYSSADLDDPTGLRYRVRSVRFTPGPELGSGVPDAVAVTSGCCSSDLTQDSPRVLMYDAATKWHTLQLYYDSQNGTPVGTVPGPSQRSLTPRQSLPDSYYSVSMSNYGGAYVLSVVATPGAVSDAGPTGQGQLTDAASRVLGEAPANYTGGIDNTVIVGVNAFAGGSNGTLTNSPGNAGDATGDIANELLDPNLSSVRLVAGDGDATGPQPGALDQGVPYTGYPGPDGYDDWAVGRLRSSGQSIAYTTTAREPRFPFGSPLRCPQGSRTINGNKTAGSGEIGVDPQCRARSSDQITGDTKSQDLFALSSYGLNAFAMAGDSGVGWAVGDRGAIERLGGAGAGSGPGAEPAAPALGAAAPTLVETAAYGSVGTIPAARPGEVPALTSQALLSPAEQQLVPAGSPDPTRLSSTPAENVAGIAMSRDGSEGWAVGNVDITPAPGSQQLTLYHYVGGRWTRCDPLGTPGVRAADPSCAGLAPLVRDQAGGRRTVNLTAIARVPLERGSDASSAGDFEAVAAGSAIPDPQTSVSRSVIVRYLHGRWTIDYDAMREADPDGTFTGSNMHVTDIGFLTPDDGWMVSNGGGVSDVWHFHNGSWIPCVHGGSNSKTPDDLAACDDRDGRVPHVRSQNAGMHLALAGARVYLYGARAATTPSTGTQADTVTHNSSVAPTLDSGADVLGQTTPFVLYRDFGQPCDRPGDGGCWRSADGGLDPPSDTPTTAFNGEVLSLSVWHDEHGYHGWASGRFGVNAGALEPQTGRGPGETNMMRLDNGVWSRWQVDDASADYLSTPTLGRPAAMVPVASQAGAGAVLAPATGSALAGSAAGPPPPEPLLVYDVAGARWRPLATPFSMIPRGSADGHPLLASVQAMTPDGQGGSWLAITPVYSGAGPDHEHDYAPSIWFYHYTDRVRRKVFDEVPNPVRGDITGATTGADGSLWVTTTSRRLFRYDRVRGWGHVDVPGWDPPGVVTKQSAALAVSVGPDGRGIVVGEGGRIADVGSSRVVLDKAAGSACAAVALGPCGTTRSLRAAAVAPDGSALVGGDARVVLWRPAGGEFRTVAKPTAAVSAQITGISMPAPDRAWLTTNTGLVFAGTLAGEVWSWTAENLDADGNSLSAGAYGLDLPLHAITLDSAGHGFAVGDGGLVLERVGDGARPWRRLDTGQLDNLYSVALSPGGGDGALIGGENGLVLTRVGGRFEVARPADFFDPLNIGFTASNGSKILGVGLLPGIRDGDVEAWAVSQGGTPTNARASAPVAILHYSRSTSSLLDPAGRVAPLPDVPPLKSGSIAFAAFGKSECQINGGQACTEFTGSGLTNEVVARHVADSIIGGSGTALDGPQFAVSTGDVNETAGQGGRSLPPDNSSVASNEPTDPSLMHRRWVDAIASSFNRARVPLYGALGVQDLSHVTACPGNNASQCSSTASSGVAANIAWRAAMSQMPAPWGAPQSDCSATQAGGCPSHGGLAFVPVADSQPDAPSGGAHTHYAFDVKRDGNPILRLVVADTSLKTLTGAAAAQSPVEEQSAWLSKVLSSRPTGERVVVVSETPSYTYGPGSATGTLTDSASFETLMLSNKVDAVVSGRLGWNGMYWMCAPALHDPSPSSGAYPDPAQQPCAAVTGTPTAGTAPAAPHAPSQAPAQLAQALQGLSAPSALPSASTATGFSPVPTVVAASAGGNFASNQPSPQSVPGSDVADQRANLGYWHGYTTIRIPPPGDTSTSVVVEQRPVFDWIGIDAQAHALHPGQHMTLHGYGREPVGSDQAPHFDAINSPAVTHRYDLVQADAQHPWLPRIGSASPFANHYVPLDSSIGTADPQSGSVTSGKGNQSRTYAVAILSVGNQAASWPIVFEPRRSYVPPPPVILPVPVPVPPIHVGAATPVSTPPTSAPPAPPSVGTPTFGASPTLPGLPPLNAPPPASPPPPATAPPPAPPASTPPGPLSLAVSPQSITFAPPSSVIPPPAPPIQPAPPGGAQREAKAKQPAAAKSEESSAVEAQDAHGRPDQVDTPSAPPGSAMTRHDPGDSRMAMTAVRASAQPSAWTQDLVYGGAMTLAALVLALGWTALWPRPRRYGTTIASPAWTRRRRGH